MPQGTRRDRGLGRGTWAGSRGGRRGMRRLRVNPGIIAAAGSARRAGVQADRRRGGHVERLLAAGLRNATKRRRRGLSSLTRPALHGPAPRHRARAGRPGAARFALVRTGHQQRHGAAPQVVHRQPFDQVQPKCAPMPARSTLGDHSAGRALERQHLVNPIAAALRRMDPRCRRPAGGPAPPSAPPGPASAQTGRSQTKPMPAGDSRPLIPPSGHRAPAPVRTARAAPARADAASHPAR
jgi:hypothetical protein